MSAIFIEMNLTLHSPTTQRNRVIENWRVTSRPANDPNITIHCLAGETVIDGGNPIIGFTRLTETSPIKSVEGRVVTTASGSKYQLGTPSTRYLGSLTLEDLEYDQEHPIPDQYMNSWLEGNNWLTI